MYNTLKKIQLRSWDIIRLNALNAQSQVIGIYTASLLFLYLFSGISLFSSDTMTIKHKDAMSISSSSSGGSKPPRPAQALPSEISVPVGTHSSKLTQQQIEELRRYIIFNIKRCQKDIKCKLPKFLKKKISIAILLFVLWSCETIN